MGIGVGVEKGTIYKGKIQFKLPVLEISASIPKTYFPFLSNVDFPSLPGS